MRSFRPRSRFLRFPSIARMLALVGCALWVAAAPAATLPPHDPLRIPIVSDEVNPHGLTNAELTQPGDIGAALVAPDSGISIDIVTEVATDDLAATVFKASH